MKKQNRIRLLFAAVDIGWRIPYYGEFLKKELKDQISIESLVKYKVPNSQYKASYTYQFNFPSYPAFIQWFLAFGIFLFSLLKYSHFYFFSGETLLTRKLRPFELWVYKLLGKKVIFHFVGSDIRDPNYLKWKTENIYDFLSGMKGADRSQNWQLKLIRDAEKYANHIFVSTPDLLSICHKAEYFPLVLNISIFEKELESTALNEERFFKTNQFKILHAPSNPDLKGTSIIDKQIKSLQEKYDFEYINTLDLNIDSGTVYPVSRYQLFSLYKEADLVIDQLAIGWYGSQSIEALLAGCKVICYIDSGLKEYLAEDCPLILADANTLEKVVREELDSPSNHSSHTARNWIKNEHLLENIGEILLNQLRE